MLRPYREELIRSIRDAGQELIDRAEDMVPKDMEGAFDFDISIAFPSGDRIPIPEITWTNARYCTNTLKRWGEEMEDETK